MAENKPNNTLTLIVFCIIAFIMFGDKLPNISDLLGKLGGGGGVSVNEQFPGAPSGKVATAIEPVRQILKNADKTDRLMLARLYREQAYVIGDNSVIQSTADIRRAHGQAGKLMDLRLKGKYGNLANAVDKALMDVLGDQAKPLDASSRRDAVDVYNGLSWGAIN